MNRLVKLVCALVAMAATAGVGSTAHGAPILLKAKTIVPGQDQGKPRLVVTTSTGGSTESLPERGLYIVQHDGIIQPSWRESLESAGAIIRSYIPENAYLVEASPAVHETIRTTIPHTYLGEYKGEYRYDASAIASLGIAVQTTASGAKAAVPTREFSILLFTEECREEVAAKIAKISGCSVFDAGGKIILANLTAAGIKEVASWPDVHWVELHRNSKICNNVAVDSARMNVRSVWEGGNLNLGLSGDGQIVGVADSGLDTGNKNTVHNDVRGRIVYASAYGRQDDWSDLNGHGTHVVGSVLGSGAESNGDVKGAAYKAKLVMQSMGTSSGSGLKIPPNPQTLFAEAYNKGARIHSNSWSWSVNDESDREILGWYSSERSYQIDDYMFSHPDMLILFAAGNDARDVSPKDGVVDHDSVSSEGSAKNSITVGASENLRTTGNYSYKAVTYGGFWPEDFPASPLNSDHMAKPYMDSAQGMVAFSGRGPCDDGRVKPDIVAPGSGILSMLSTRGKIPGENNVYYHNMYYQYMQGTSMSCPLVAGSAALVREWLQKNRNIDNPDGATIKAILLAGAKSLAPGQYGEGKTQEIPKSYPNNVEGWGQVNLGNSLQNSAGLLVYDAKVIEQGKTHTFTVKATAGNALNIVMAYTDAPGNPGSGKALVNNLDLLVKTPSGKLIYPNSGTSADNLNNVEGVRIAAGDVATGTYTITVTGTDINTGMDPNVFINGKSITDGKSNAIRYSLVVNGATEIDPPANPPANDDVANANTISLQSGSTTGSNVAATKDNGNIGGLASVWWKWTPTKSGTATFDTEGSSFDTTLMVYTYANGTYRLERENNDATTAVSWSRVTFEAASGTTYYIAVGGSSGKTGNITLKWGLQVVQKSDLCFGLGSNNASWPAAVFLSGTMGSAVKTTTFKNKQTIYSYWSVKNDGNVSPSGSSVILHEILKSGTVVQSWTENLSAVAAGQVSFRSNNPDSHFRNLGEGSYTYRITLDSQKTIDELNESNNQVPYTFSVMASTPLPVPTNLYADGSGMPYYDLHYVKISWNPVKNDDNKSVEGYYVYRNTSPVMPDKPWKTKTGSGNTAVVDADCKAGTTYYYWVVAFDGAAQSAPTSYVSITPTEDGSGDFSPTVSVSGTTISFSWEAGDTWTRNFYVYRSTEPIQPDDYLAKLSSGDSGYPDDSVEPGITYYYWIVKDHILMGEISSQMLTAKVPSQKADVGFYQWSGWPRAVFLSDSPSEATKTTTFKSGQSIYLWNGGSNFGHAAVPAGWKMRHQVLDRETGSVITEFDDSLGALTVVYAEGSAWAIEHDAIGILQRLRPGMYTYRCILDVDYVVDESDETNNAASFDFDVDASECDLCFGAYGNWLAGEYVWFSMNDYKEQNAAYLPTRQFAEGENPYINFVAYEKDKTDYCLCPDILFEISNANDETIKSVKSRVDVTIGSSDGHYRDLSASTWGGAFPYLSPGTYFFKVTVDPDGVMNDRNVANNMAYVQFAITNAHSVGISDALESNLPFAFSGATAPFVQTQFSIDGKDAVQFGPCLPCQTNSLSTPVVGPGKLEFNWSCCCHSVGQSEGHEFVFLVDGIKVKGITGDGRGQWQNLIFDVPEGEHLITWAYRKDAYRDSCLDSVWLDQVSWTPSITPASPTAKSISGDESGVKISFGASANAIAYRIYRATDKTMPDDYYDEIPYAAGTTLEYNDISASPGVEYHYWMSAVGTGGESDAVYCGTTYRIASIGVSSDSVTFDANGGRKTISVWANAEWEVRSKPDWVTATKTTIQSGDHSEVVLEIAVGVTSSEREGTIKLVAAKGTAHPVASSDIHVSQSAVPGQTPPNWTPVVKEDTLVVYATVFDTSANVAIEADGTRLGAFAANGECRGWATIMDGPVGRLFQLSIGVENATEGGIVLKVWNSETGEVVEISERIACNSDKQIGTIASPRVFTIGATELDISLKEGWNWISTCLVSDDSSVGSVFSGCTFANDDVVKTSNGAATYYNGVWYPSTYKIDPGVAYVVKKSAGGTEKVTLRGTLMDDGISVKVGWNWIGMTHLSAQTISEISHSGGFANNDVVKNSNASATYYGGQWYPSTFSVNPGMGYKANLSKAGKLLFKANAAESSSAMLLSSGMNGNIVNNSLTSPGWTPVTQEDTMVAYLQVKKPDGSGNFESAGSLLAAFSSSGECRGVVEVMDGPAGKVYQLSIGVASATESGFTLKIWDSDSDQVYAIDEELACNSEKIIGKIFNPQVLTAKAPSPSTCTVSFNANGGTGTMDAQTVDKGVATKLNKCTFTKTGYSFKEWSGSDGNIYGDQQSVTLSADLALTAQWTGNVYRVTLDMQSGSGGSPYVDATYGAAMPAITLPTRTDHDFGGYFTGTGGSGTKYYNADGTSARAWDKASATTLYAYWIPTNIPLPDGDYSQTIDGIEWKYTIASGVAIVQSPGNSEAAIPESTEGEIVIPSVLGGCRVVKIGNNALLRCSGLNSLTIPDTVTNIGAYAFAECSGLKDLAIGRCVARIGLGAFEGCENLNEVHISDLAAWCEICFDAYHLAGGHGNFIGSGSNPLQFAKKIFVEDKLVSELVIPDSVRNISSGTFECLDSISSIEISAFVTNIEKYAFVSCANVAKIKFLSADTDVNGRAFYGCEDVKEVWIPERICKAGSGYSGGMERYFDAYGSITNVVVLDGVDTIGPALFHGCTNLLVVSIPTSVTNIAEATFLGCYKLQRVILPDQLRNIGDEAFSHCYSLESVTIPDQVESIGSYAYWFCTNLAEVVIGNSVVRIGESAFRNCDSLVYITVPQNVNYIGDEAFGCDNLTSILFEGDAPEMGSAVFWGATDSCCAYVHWGSTGWGVEIPGTWNGIGIKYISSDFVLYEISFDKNGGMGTMSSQEFTEGVEQALTKNAFKKSGYMFVGWKDQNGGTYEDEQVIMPASDLTLTAQWEKIAVRCEPNNATYNWRGADLTGTIGVECNTDWTVTVSDTDTSWITLSGSGEGTGDGTVKYSLTQNDEKKARDGTITVTSKIDGTVKATFTVNQKARPSEPDLDIQNGVLVGVDMNGYDKLDVPSGVTAIGANAFACNDEVCSVRIPATVTEIGDSAFAGCVNLTNVVFDGNAPTTGNDIFKDTPDGLVVTVRNDKTGWPPEGSKWPEGDANARTVAVIKNYIVSFDWNGWEDGPAIEDIVVEPGDQIKLPYPELHTSESQGWSKNREGVRPGYSFGWWNESGDIDEEPLGAYYVPEKSILLKARWYPHSYTFKFDANGGKPAGQEVSGQSFGEEWKKDEVEEPALANAVFDGWWTAKTGGDPVDLNGVCSTVGKLGGTMTLYAHWRKMFKATVKDGGVSEDAENYIANVTVLSGTDLYLEAADKSDKDMEFAKWTYSPATANLGENFDARNPNSSFTMPDAAVTLTANYIAKPGYVTVFAYEVNRTLNEDDDPQGIEWSDDGKVWTPVGDDNAYPVKTGKSVAIQFRSTDPRWIVPAKVTYPIVEGETFDVKVVATRVSVVETDSAFEQFGASGTVAMTPKNGQVLPGKPVTLTAKPGKDTVFAYWTVGGEKVGYTATFKYAPDVDCTATAVFRLKSAVEDPVLDADAVVPSANAMVGVAFESQVPLADAAYPAKFSAKGLPAGLKIDAASGVISGVPTKAGDSVVTVTAAGGVNTKAKPSVTIPITIKPLPAWAQGTFTGYVYGDETDYGFATFTVSAAGKVSGKMSLMGTNWTFAASSYDAETRTLGNEDGAGDEFVINADLKSGKLSSAIKINVYRERSPERASALENAVAYGSSGNDLNFSLFRTIWPKASKGAFYWEGVYTLSIANDFDYGCGYLSLTVDKSGNVKATGKLADGMSVSATSPLLYDPAYGCFAYLYTAPASYKGGSFALAVKFGETVGALADMDLSLWVDRNPQSTGEYGEGFHRAPEFVGAYYDKLQKLKEYYDSLKFTMDEQPLLSFTFKETKWNDSGKKVTESEVREDFGHDLSGQSGLTATVDDKGAIVVAKATKPTQDNVTKEWRYDGANDGGLTLSFTQATGIFKGSYTFWYDYVSAYDATTDKSTWSHTSKKVNFEGIMVQGEEEMRGFYLWDATGTYEDEKTGNEKTYKYKQSFPVWFSGE